MPGNWNVYSHGRGEANQSVDRRKILTTVAGSLEEFPEAD
jgi:hypothetical protein